MTEPLDDTDSGADDDPQDAVDVSARDLAGRDGAALLLGLADAVERRQDDRPDVHPDLYRATITRLRRVGTDLAAAHGHADLLDADRAPMEGTALASQLVELLRDSPQSSRTS